MTLAVGGIASNRFASAYVSLFVFYCKFSQRRGVVGERRLCTEFVKAVLRIVVGEAIPPGDLFNCSLCGGWSERLVCTHMCPAPGKMAFGVL